jgi:hypothetical protein
VVPVRIRRAVWQEQREDVAYDFGRVGGGPRLFPALAALAHRFAVRVLVAKRVLKFAKLEVTVAAV